MQRKKYFSPRVKTVVAGFKNNSKERHIFSEFKHGFCDNMKNKKICAKEWLKKHVFHSHFFYFSSQAKTHALISSKGALNCYCTENAEKGLSHLVKMHFSISGHVTLGMVR